MAIATTIPAPSRPASSPPTPRTDRRSPVAYIRRSTADAGSPGDVSRAVQDAAIAELAARDGHDGEVRGFVDWARSADEEKAERRTEYAAMLRAVERGEVSTIYAYSLDRLVRSIAMTAELFRATRTHDVRIVTQREGDLSDDGNPSKWLQSAMLSVFGEFELRTQKSRSAAAQARRIERGDDMGQPPFGYKVERLEPGENGAPYRLAFVRDPAIDLDGILAVVRDSGSVLAACRLLEERGVPAPRGGSKWSPSALTRIVEREAPELLRPRGPTGRRGAAIRSPLAGLVRCHCGQMMTPNVTRGQVYCHRGQLAGSATHGRMAVAVGRLMPWIRDELHRLALPDELQVGGAVDEDRKGLEERRRRIGHAFAAGSLDQDEHDRLLAGVHEELAALDAQASVMAVPDASTIAEIDLEAAPPAVVNRALRAVWESIELDEAMQPVRAVWRVPEWRREI